MRIDIPTIFFVLALICGLIGIVFLVAWFRRRRGAVALRAGLAGMMASVAIGLILARGHIPDRISIDVANMLLALAFGFIWAAVRALNRVDAPWVYIVAGAAVWLAACTIPPFYAEMGYRIGLISWITAGYSLACAYEFWRTDGGVRLDTQKALAVVCLLHGMAVTYRGIHSAFVSPLTAMFEGDTLQALLMLEPAIALIAITILGIGLVRERAERELKLQAETDGLTGVLNRNAFFAAAERAVRDAERSSRSVALLVFDLDHFKSINDIHGHLVGDRTLQFFTRVIRRAVRENDIVGRIGGEEFAVLLDGVDRAAAEAIAERIRRDVSLENVSKLNGCAAATVSAGVAVAVGGDIRTLFERADKALYDAKRGGRDQVKTAVALAG